jgi:polysaccharide export outer membrane protein
MKKLRIDNNIIRFFVVWGILVLSACSSAPVLKSNLNAGSDVAYLIGPGDTINVFVWGNADLTATVPVRPDGKITTPLVEDVQASGKTPTQLARDMEKRLTRFIKNPVVTVIVTGFQGRYSEQVRVLGQVKEPKAVSYREGMTLLDLMIEVGGLTDFAAGNNAKLVRKVAGKEVEYNLLVDDLIRDGQISANVKILPGDIIIIPESWF